ncbi:hypothetical protein WICPIJ_010017 [Wickerhamomyces pijperi]|uniref:Uncharacterized protein n=1 Tax=Wickerhamomyces pijperi TaxID=599730 RepID=A0A9P8PIC8_WICPI|nr:hypothetical protein WICPIJ_010017 [Wickerhamomyces pijperi]
MTTPVQPQLNIPIPDLRFESTFRKALDAAFKSHAESLAKSQSQSQSNSKTQSQTSDLPLKPLPLLHSTYIVARVILKDVLLMPLIQGFALSYFLLGFRPWLSNYVVPFGRKCGLYVMNVLSGNKSSYRRSY